MTKGRASRIWYKIRSNTLFSSIEWGSLSVELVNKHNGLFTRDEMAELSDGMPCYKEAVDSAMKRTPQSVLHAFYKSLLDTQHCGGASQHAAIAEEIEKESECECVLCLIGACEWLERDVTIDGCWVELERFVTPLFLVRAMACETEALKLSFLNLSSSKVAV